MPTKTTRSAPPTERKMLIIGAGPVGLGIARALKEHGIAYDQIDADEGVGGNWRHGVYETAHIISSRKTTQYNEFPMPEAYPDFPSRQNMLDYMRAYASHFDLLPAIAFNTKAVRVHPAARDLWDVSFADESVRTYKGVLCCNGHHWQKRWPDYPGRVSGRFMHSKDFRHPDELRDKRVLVIGGGNSACDVVSEAARVAQSAHLSLRNGVWFLPKTIFGKPLVEAGISKYVPVSMQRLLLKTVLKITTGDYTRYGLPRPNHKIFDKHPTISSEVLHYIKHGRIEPRPEIERFDGTHVVFTDGTKTQFDTVICATGFHVSYPFLPDALAPVEGPVVKCYGGALLDTHKHLYLIGWGQPRYGFGPLVSPASDLLARMILLQDKIRHPLGYVFKRMKQKPPEIHLADPHVVLRQMKRARRTLPLVRFIARRLDKKENWTGNPILPTPAHRHNLAALPVY